MCMYVIISNKNLIIRFIDIFFIFIKMYINNNYRFIGIFKISNKIYCIDYIYKIWDKFKMYLKVYWLSVCDRNFILI